MNNSRLYSRNYFLFSQALAFHLPLAFTRNANWPTWQRLAGFILVCAALGSGNAFGGRVSDIRGTKHNLSAEAAGTSTAFSGSVPTRTVYAKTEKQVCVFCHTPHGATLGLMPLWNRKLASQTYTPYSSSSLDANVIQGVLGQPGGSSKLCLSCHDGTLAIGSVNVLNGLGSQEISMEGTDLGGVMPAGSGGYTRNLGVDLTNDHPISVSYTSALSERDGELRSVDANQKYPAGQGTIIGVRRPGYNPKAPLEPTGVNGTGQIQCAACHDPHLRETDAKVGNQKFLILNRFQEQANQVPSFDSLKDIGCVACHDKNQGQGVWIYSAHANPLVMSVGITPYTYTDAAANQREFPTAAGDGAATNLPMWKASCLNCHDTHTAQGSRWLLREGTANGISAIEETCYQCHSSLSSNISNAIEPLTIMPDIKADFALSTHMPIKSTEQAANSEVHDIGGDFNDAGSIDCSGLLNTNYCGANFVERRAKLGVGNLNNRHAECTDCHNPHRAVKFNSFVGNGGSLAGTPDTTGTHKHTDTAGYTHTNIASGALRGTFGVEPIYGAGASFAFLPTGYTVKFGDPKTNTSTVVSQPYVTREYQICLKCHSDYGYDDDNLSDIATITRPSLGTTNNLTPNPTNGLTHYTNQAREFQAPSAHMGEGTAANSGAFSGTPPGQSYTVNFQTNNHRSWHPVMDATGRTLALTGVGAAAFNLPWSNAVGTQTMYCDDCHGSNVPSATSVIPDFASGRSWGSHGSGNNFILKGAWDSVTGDSDRGNGAAGKTGTVDLCFKCHDYNSYALGEAAAALAGGVRTGFWTTDNGGHDGHQLHVDRILLTNPANKGTRCNWCHVAVPHGWKNKGLLVNLNDVGSEAGQVAGTQVRNGVTTAYNAAPYYLNAVLKVINFKTSGNWTAADCGSPGAPGNGLSGKNWMTATSSENCTTPP